MLKRRMLGLGLTMVMLGGMTLPGLAADPPKANHRHLTLNRARLLTLVWLVKVGGGFHPDVTADEYEPKLTGTMAMDYDRDMKELRQVTKGDPCKYCVEMMTLLGM